MLRAIEEAPSRNGRALKQLVAMVKMAGTIEQGELAQQALSRRFSSTPAPARPQTPDSAAA
jgi:hypothetical protein